MHVLLTSDSKSTAASVALTMQCNLQHAMQSEMCVRHLAVA